MLNRLIAFMDQIKTISSDRIYFCNGIVYSMKNSDQIFQCWSDVTKDSKGKNFFNDKTFYIDYSRFKEFFKMCEKKHFKEITFIGNTIIINTDIPSTKLIFEWSHENDIELKKTKKFYIELESKFSKNPLLNKIRITGDELDNIIKARTLYISNNKIIVDTPPKSYMFVMYFFPKKHLGKLLKSSNYFDCEIYSTDRPNIYYVKIEIQNSSLISYYYGQFVNSKDE